MARATRVRCGCGWRGRRVSLFAQGLECCEGTHCVCLQYGRCPKCGGPVHPTPPAKINVHLPKPPAIAAKLTQGLVSVRYEPADLVSLAWVSERNNE